MSNEISLLRTMIYADDHATRSQAMGELTTIVQAGQCCRTVILIKGYLQQLDLMNSTLQDRLDKARKAVEQFKLDEGIWQQVSA